VCVYGGSEFKDKLWSYSSVKSFYIWISKMSLCITFSVYTNPTRLVSLSFIIGGE